MHHLAEDRPGERRRLGPLLEGGDHAGQGAGHLGQATGVDQRRGPAHGQRHPVSPALGALVRLEVGHHAALGHEIDRPLGHQRQPRQARPDPVARRRRVVRAVGGLGPVGGGGIGLDRGLRGHRQQPSEHATDRSGHGRGLWATGDRDPAVVLPGRVGAGVGEPGPHLVDRQRGQAGTADPGDELAGRPRDLQAGHREQRAGGVRTGTRRRNPDEPGQRRGQPVALLLEVGDDLVALGTGQVADAVEAVLGVVQQPFEGVAPAVLVRLEDGAILRARPHPTPRRRPGSRTIRIVRRRRAPPEDRLAANSRIPPPSEEGHQPRRDSAVEMVPVLGAGANPCRRITIHLVVSAGVQAVVQAVVQAFVRRRGARAGSTLSPRGRGPGFRGPGGAP